MIERDVVFAPEAQNDLEALYLKIARAASPAAALAYLDRLQAWLDGFSAVFDGRQNGSETQNPLRFRPNAIP